MARVRLREADHHDKSVKLDVIFGPAAKMTCRHSGAREGGSWLVRISLAQTGHWLVGRGEVPSSALQDVPKELPDEELERWSMTSEMPVGRLRHLRPVVRLSEPPPHWTRPTVPLGYHEPAWPAR